MSNPVIKIDHVAVTTTDLDRFVDFYKKVLGAEVIGEHEIDGIISIVTLAIGGAMLNVHRAGHSHWLVARVPTPGSLDLCFRWGSSIETAMEIVDSSGVQIIEGPVARRCSDGDIGQSIYFRDPDGNLLELLAI